MKLATIFITMIYVLGCGGNKELSVDSKSNAKLLTETNVIENTDIKTSEMTQDSDVIFEYSAITRGNSFKVKVSREFIDVKDASGTNKRMVCSTETWDELMSLLKKIDLKTIPTLESPSKAHQYDGAMAATLKITHKGETYETVTFDHGKPNKQLDSLVEVLVTMGISH